MHVSLHLAGLVFQRVEAATTTLGRPKAEGGCTPASGRVARNRRRFTPWNHPLSRNDVAGPWADEKSESTTPMEELTSYDLAAGQRSWSGRLRYHGRAEGPMGSRHDLAEWLAAEGPRRREPRQGAHRTVGRCPGLQPPRSDDGRTATAQRDSRPCRLSNSRPSVFIPETRPSPPSQASRATDPSLAWWLDLPSYPYEQHSPNGFQATPICGETFASSVVDHGARHRALVPHSCASGHGRLRHRGLGQPAVWWPLCRFLHRRHLATTTSRLAL